MPHIRARGLFAALASVAVTALATWRFSQDMPEGPGSSAGLGFLFSFSGGLMAGGIALVVAFVGALVALWPRAARP